MTSSASGQRAGLIAAAALLMIYGATLAPDVTWWDSGEMIAAAHSLGIPHPPGAPLYVLLANVATRVFWWMGPAASVNFLSALCMAAACAVGAAIITSFTRSVTGGLGAALCAGSMATAWMTATEAEVYAPALLLSALMLWSGMRAGDSGEQRWVNLTAYLIALSAPLHISALVAAPAAIMLAAWSVDGYFRLPRAILLTGVMLCSAGVGKASLPFIIVGLVMIAATLVIAAQAATHVDRKMGSRSRLTACRDKFRGNDNVRDMGKVLVALTAIAASCILFMPMRAAWDPLINQGNPESFQSLMAVLSRQQYDVAAIFPRQAPLWLQAGNYLQYLDWQFALGLAPTVMPSIVRTAFAVVFLLLALAGLRRMGSVSANVSASRSQWAMAMLFLCASAGVVVYLNFKAGPTIGVGLIPDDAPHEARERDYFFLLSFWTVGLLAGMGAVSVATRLRRLAVPAGLAIAALPMALNLSAADRRTAPDASLARRMASVMLATLPTNAVLFVAGDNDTYPIWYMQIAHQLRRDVAVVTIPLLGADWYRLELQRRHNLSYGAGGPWVGLPAVMQDVIERARSQGRPVAFSVSVPAEERSVVGDGWVLAGFHYREVTQEESRRSSTAESRVDVAAVERAAAAGERRMAELLRPSVDPIARQMARILECPSLALDWLRGGAGRKLLDSRCNFR